MGERLNQYIANVDVASRCEEEENKIRREAESSHTLMTGERSKPRNANEDREHDTHKSTGMDRDAEPGSSNSTFLRHFLGLS